MIKIHIGGENSSLQKAGVQNGQIAETAGEEEHQPRGTMERSNLRDDENATQAEALASSGGAAASGLQERSRLSASGRRAGAEQRGG